MRETSDEERACGAREAGGEKEGKAKLKPRVVQANRRRTEAVAADSHTHTRSHTHDRRCCCCCCCSSQQPLPQSPLLLHPLSLSLRSLTHSHCASVDVRSSQSRARLVPRRTCSLQPKSVSRQRDLQTVKPRRRS